MNKDQLAELHRLIDDWAAKQPSLTVGGMLTSVPSTTTEEPKRELPKDKRVIRTKSTGDRVYLIDETAKTKAWVTSPEILGKLGFELSDVQDVDDSDLLGYAMTASLYRVED
jgi:hypothetical protein